MNKLLMKGAHIQASGKTRQLEAPMSRTVPAVWGAEKALNE